jgi:hypothetical protein
MQAVDRAVNIVNGVIGASVRGKGGVRGAAESLEELMHSELAAPDGGRAAQGIAESEDMDVHPQKVIRVASKVSVHRMVQVCNAASVPCRALCRQHAHSPVSSILKRLMPSWPGEQLRCSIVFDDASMSQEVPGRSLKDYLALPVEEYSMLDPSTVSYLGDSKFRLKFPFKEWFKLDMTPELVMHIRPQPSHDRVCA